MENTTVTINLNEYNQLRDKANMNQLMLDRIISYEIQINNMQQKQYEIENKLFTLEDKFKLLK